MKMRHLRVGVGIVVGLGLILISARGGHGWTGFEWAGGRIGRGGNAGAADQADRWRSRCCGMGRCEGTGVRAGECGIECGG